ncbi:hypothetical protein SteCoe_3635 [Stentor coeruleus]|uniref:carbonic anhydrase n=1 Tax=Stentor coeruleus TaxID=5963 RepID=A0A1R2CWN9_9CILI|nr:hypothetical protein SteCoe_3635 [Stentor coeruleus]
MKLVLILITLSLSQAWDYGNQGSWGGNCNSITGSPRSLNIENTSKISSSLQMKMAFLGYTGTQTITNTGNLIKIKSALGYIEVGDMNGRRIFNVESIEFHTPSEHKIGGTFYPMEMEIICRIMDKYWERDKPNLAIVSVIIQNGKESYFLNTLDVMHWPNATGNTLSLVPSSNINLREIVANTDEYYHYKGTSTTPDLGFCQDEVLWYIIKDVKEAAEWQVKKITNLFEESNTKTLVDTSTTLYQSDSVFYLVSLFILVIL